MPKQKIRKSVLFHEGISDDADRFLLEPPSVDYVENYRIDKQGVLSKRPGFGPSALTTVQNATSDPFMLHAVGETLYTMSDTAFHSWSNGSWTSSGNNAYAATSELVVETPQLRGMSNPEHAQERSGGALVKTFVAYEVRRGTHKDMYYDWVNDSDSPLLDTHIIIAEYEPDGTFIQQTRIDGHSPRLVEATSGSGSDVFLFYVTFDTSTNVGPLRMMDLSTSGTPDYSLNRSVDLIHGYPIVHTFGDGQPQSPRLGQGIDFQGRYVVGWQENDDKFVLAYGSGKLLRLTTVTRTGTTQNSYPLLDADFGATAFDMSIAGSVLFLLFARWDIIQTPTDDWDIYVYIAPIPLSGAFNGLGEVYETIAGGSHDPAGSISPDTYINGTINNRFDKQGDNRVFIALTRSGDTNYGEGSPVPGQGAESNNFRAWNNRDDNMGVSWYIYDSAPWTFVNSGFHAGQRVVTNAEWDTDRWLVGLQQWIDHTPHVVDPGAVNDFISTLPSIKPVTTAICAFSDILGSDFKNALPIAALDSGLSQSCEPPEAEMRTHLASLTVSGGAAFVANRVVLEAPDTNYWEGAQTSGTWQRDSNIQAWSSALCRVHRLKRFVASDEKPSITNLGDGIAVPLALPLWMDRGFTAEFGPLDSPEIMRVVPNDWEVDNPTEGPMPTQAGAMVENVGTPDTWRKFVAVIGYTDASGNRHRSAPSATLWVDEPEKQCTVYVTPPITALPLSQEYWCEVYTSWTSDTEPQLAGSTTFVSSDRFVNAIECPVRIGETIIKSGGPSEEFPDRASPPVYTDGGVLAADPWPAFSLSVATSTRFWIVDSINRGRVVPSKLFEDYTAPEYNPTLAINLGDERNLTAIGQLDDKVVVFEPDDIHVIYGEGPDNRGQGQDFAVHYIATDVGCQDQESVIETPLGLMFYSSPRGFYLLDRNLQIQFIGAGVEDIALGINVIAATLDPRKAEVRFLVEEDPNAVQNDPDGPDPDQDAITRPPRPSFGNALPENTDSCLSFNYERKAWMLYTNYEGRAATMYQRKYTRLLSDWSIWQESETSFEDPTGENRMLLRTPWIRLGEQVQDYARLWRITFLGRYLSSLQALILHLDPTQRVYEAGDLIVRLYYDYEADYAQEKRMRVQDFGFDPFNADPKRAERFQFKVTPKRGRAQAVKIEIEEVNSEDMGENRQYGLGRGYEIVSADFEIGVDDKSTRYLQAAVSK